VRRGIAAIAGDLACDPLRRRSVAIDHGNMRAVNSEGTAGRSPNSAATSRDDRDLSGKIFWHLFSTLLQFNQQPRDIHRSPPVQADYRRLTAGVHAR